MLTLRSCLTISAVFAAILGAGMAGADPIFIDGAHPELDAQMTRHERQFYGINSVPSGLSLDAHAKDAEAVELINQFLAQDAIDDPQEAVGKHAYELLVSYGEYGDLGFFGGVALAGTCLRYLTLRRDGAPDDVLEQARHKVVRAADAWHHFYVLSGGNGVVARGIRRMVKEFDDQPTLPVQYPELVPLFDDDGAPLPQPKNNGAYRVDNSGGAYEEGEWIWKDSASKDQVTGQILGLVMLYEAMKDDPDIDQSLVARLQEDARGLAKVLMTKREISKLEGPVGMGEYDLIIMDADGRPTYHHDLNPLSLEKLYMTEEQGGYNVFNLFLALGVMKGLYHVTGDEDIEQYIYVELLHNRDYIGLVNNALNPTKGAIDYIYAGTMTNFDNPDMTSIGLFLALYTEKDPAVYGPLRSFLEKGWWRRAGESHTAAQCKQPLWHSIYLAITAAGAEQSVVVEMKELLLAFDLGPYWNPVRINCDAEEVAAGECLAVDGKTVLTISAAVDDGNNWMATEALDPSIRPPSNFDARSNPFRVNGGGGLRLNPGGDLLCAYWMGRYMEFNSAGQFNLSPLARDHMPVGGWPSHAPDVAEEAGEPDVVTTGDLQVVVDVVPEIAAVDSGAEVGVEQQDKSNAGGCSVGHSGANEIIWLLCFLGLLLWRISGIASTTAPRRS